MDKMMNRCHQMMQSMDMMMMEKMHPECMGMMNMRNMMMRMYNMSQHMEGAMNNMQEMAKRMEEMEKQKTKE